MAEARAESKAVEQPKYPATTFALAMLALGWLVPGGGHLAQKRWVRGGLLFIAVTSMFALGLLMQGKVYALNFGDILDMLGFVGDLGAGGLYLLARVMDWGRGAIHLATADYGTKFIIVSGLLNVISAIDGYDIATGKKQ